MKKIIAVFLLICFLCGCSYDKRIEYYQALSKTEPICDAYPIRTYYDNDTYVVILFERHTPVKGVSFSLNRNASNVIDIDLVAIDNIQVFIGKTLSEIEDELGKYHIDIGSGQSMPSYITKDGYLICFSVDNYTNVICHVGKTDLFTGESIEWYFAE